ncbi:MAG: sigma-54 interaction domain-containing protein [Kiloniellales bacterium]
MADRLLEAAAHHAPVRELLESALREGSRTRQRPAEDKGQRALADNEQVMIGDSEPMRLVFDRIRRFASTDVTILITGESGTGKEMAARALHERSRFAEGPFIAVNCGAIPETLIASELFGHEKGAFTGAVSRRLGKMELAKRGTLFLDEVGDLPLETQAHLLRFLQESTIERVGGQRTIKVETRVVAATNVDLEAAVAAGRFRKDLFFRLDALRLPMPALRERPRDIDLLVRYFVEKFARELGRPVPVVDVEVLADLRAYRWPGNVRELISKIRRAIIMADSEKLEIEHFSIIEPPAAVSGAASRAAESIRQGLLDSRGRAEAKLVQEALAEVRFNISEAARNLGVSRATMYRLMKKYGIARAGGRGRKRRGRV